MVCKGGFYKGVSLCSLRECNIFVQRLFLVWMPATFFLSVLSIILLIRAWLLSWWPEPVLDMECSLLSALWLLQLWGRVCPLLDRCPLQCEVDRTGECSHWERCHPVNIGEGLVYGKVHSDFACHCCAGSQSTVSGTPLGPTSAVEI